MSDPRVQAAAQWLATHLLPPLYYRETLHRDFGLSADLADDAIRAANRRRRAIGAVAVEGWRFRRLDGYRERLRERDW